MATQFSSDGAEVMQRAAIAAGAAGRSPTAGLEEFYELERTTAFVSDNGFCKVRGYFAPWQKGYGHGFFPVNQVLYLCKEVITCSENTVVYTESFKLVEERGNEVCWFVCTLYGW